MKKYLLLFLILGVGIALAATTGGGEGAMPWESPLSKIQDSITGPVAMGISLLAIVAAGAGLVFGGEISGFIKTIIYIVLVIALIVAASSIMTNVFGKGMLI
jgi:type IV secretion system protein VirB2